MLSDSSNTDQGSGLRDTWVRDTSVVHYWIERAERPRDESSLTVNVQREVLANHAGVGWRAQAIHQLEK